MASLVLGVVESFGTIADGLTIVLMEHNLGEVTRIARRLVVMHNGGILAQGPPGAVMARADVREAYLGAAHA